MKTTADSPRTTTRPRNRWKAFLASGWVAKVVVLAFVVVGLVLGLTFLVAPAAAAHFSDVNSNTYDNPDYPDAVSALSDLGVVGGFDDGTFRPHDPVTRQQFAKMIVKLLGYQVTGNEYCPFIDVARGTSATDPFYPDKYIAVCATNGITTGIDSTHFAPYNNIKRVQVITMVVRAAQRYGVPLESPSASYYAGTISNSTFRNLTDPVHGLNVQIAEMNNLFWGIWPDQGSTWNIYGTATRGEVAQIMWRLLQKMGGQTTTTTQPVTTTTTARPPSTTTTTMPGATLEAHDDFSDPSTGWGNVSSFTAEGYRYYYQNGTYVVEIQPGDDQWLPSYYTGVDLDASWVEADITLAAGDQDCGAGLFLHFQDTYNFYLFEIDPEGNYAVYKRLAGTWTKIAGWTNSAAINTLGISNHVKFSVSGTVLTATVNGYVVCTVSDGSLTHGSAGFFAEALGSTPVKAIFDNLQVWSQFYSL